MTQHHETLEERITVAGYFMSHPENLPPNMSGSEKTNGAIEHKNGHVAKALTYLSQEGRLCAERVGQYLLKRLNPERGFRFFGSSEYLNDKLAPVVRIQDTITEVSRQLNYDQSNALYWNEFYQDNNKLRPGNFEISIAALLMNVDKDKRDECLAKVISRTPNTLYVTNTEKALEIPEINKKAIYQCLELFEVDKDFANKIVVQVAHVPNIPGLLGIIASNLDLENFKGNVWKALEYNKGNIYQIGYDSEINDFVLMENYNPRKDSITNYS